MTQEELRITIEQELDKQLGLGVHEILIDYRTISKAFPGDPSPRNFEDIIIDGAEFKSWAKGLGWSVKLDQESTSIELKETPNVLFSRIRS